MRIVVGIASRNRPLALVGVVMGLHRLQSGLHDVSFVIGNDLDDEETRTIGQKLALELGRQTVKIRTERRSTLSVVWNRLVAYDRTADVVTLMSDRTFCITPGWDDILADAAASYPKRCLWWSSPGDEDHTVPIVSKDWLAASGYSWCSDIFPFWFSDIENREKDIMISRQAPVKVQANFAGSRSTTVSGRDFAFWFRVFSALRKERMRQASVMAASMGMPWLDFPDDAFDAWDAEMQRKCPEFEATFGDKRPPSPEYRAARDYAEAILQSSAPNLEGVNA